MQFVQFDPAKQPKCKVELHIHLDGAIRLTTAWELGKQKGVELKAKTLDDLYESWRVKTPSSLADFLKPFHVIFSIISGDPEALDRITYEFCEDIAKEGILYCEVRYSPHLLAYGLGEVPISATMTPRDVVVCVNQALARGSADFKVTVKSILCCFVGRPEWSNEVLGLCLEFQNQGVVGIDIAGDEAKEQPTASDIEVFQRAATLGIHRTAHAGEAGGASNVEIAINDLLVERIGHGYHVVDDECIYHKAKEMDIHFEVCPFSSIFTGSVPVACPKHPIVRFAEDNVNFSINRDDPAIIQKTLDDEYTFLRGFGLKDVHLIRANFNAARSCFLPPDEKEKLIQELRKIYGIDENSTDSNIISPIQTLGATEKDIPDAEVSELE